jgi:hypothetical protein
MSGLLRKIFGYPAEETAFQISNLLHQSRQDMMAPYSRETAETQYFFARAAFEHQKKMEKKIRPRKWLRRHASHG